MQSLLGFCPSLDTFTAQGSSDAEHSKAKARIVRTISHENCDQQRHVSRGMKVSQNER